jgi:2-haloacid dehalogenase
METSSMAKPRLITFDVYNALLDIQGGLTPVFSEATGLDRASAGPIVATWRAKQMERAAASNSLGLTRTLFRDCTRQALDYVCQRHGLELSGATKENLVFAWDQLSFWPETDAAVAAVKTMGYPIAILSNGDQDMLDALAALFSTKFDHVLSSQTAGYYKPHPAVYALPEKLLGIPRDETLHVAGGSTDVLGTVAYGIPCIWSNKTGDALLDPAYPPAHEISDLSKLAALL